MCDSVYFYGVYQVGVFQPFRLTIGVYWEIILWTVIRYNINQEMRFLRKYNKHPGYTSIFIYIQEISFSINMKNVYMYSASLVEIVYLSSMYIDINQ